MTQVTDNLEPPPRIVKPRIRKYTKHPVIAIHDSHFTDRWFEGGTALTEQGETMTVEQLIRILPDLPPTLLVKVGAADFASHLNGVYLLKYPDTWQWRISTHERDIANPEGVRVAARVSTVVHYLGWKGGNYHKFIDPVTMYGKGINDIWPGDDPPIVRLLRWAVALRDFCDREGVDVRPTTGGIASQFLTDRRFYPNARRKVPTGTNERAREQIPGNYYVLNVIPNPTREYTAHYLDQHRAHHYHARTIALPDADTLYAHGRFTDLDGIAFPTPLGDFYGLYCVQLERLAGQHRFTWLPQGDSVKTFVYSNEIPHLADMGYRITGIYAAWGSRHRDTGLAKYAHQAETWLDEHHNAPWLKPLLLSTYGVLATKPRAAEAIFRLASGGEPVEVHTGRRTMNGRLTKGRHKLEPRIANVLHRGMIEAATRSESVGLAQWLADEGHHILSIYADAVIVEADDDRPLPTIPPPWRSKDTLHHLKFINQQAFMSGEMTKLPGINRELIPYRQWSSAQAPRKRLIQAITGKTVVTNRRI